MSKQIDCNYIKIQQPIGVFYIAAIDWADIIEIAHADIRRIETKEKRDVETYLGIQRELSPNRVNEIARYVKLIDATFPTSIILSIRQADIRIEATKLIINKSKDVAKIIDGQHRIEGIKKGYDSSNGPFQLNVTIFVEMDLEDQAIVFSTINKAQTKVNKSLVYDLYEFAESRSPQKTCHNIARLLNKEDSPFKDKIKVLGRAEDKEKETITQATFVESLIKYISKDPMSDRDMLKRGKRLNRVEGKEEKIYFLRNLFIEESDDKIAKIIWNYFDAVKKKWPDAWNTTKTGNILNKSTGFSALMRFFKDSYLSFGRIGDVVTVDEFYSIFSKITLENSDFNPEKYKPGQSGQAQLYTDLRRESGLQ